MLDKVREKIDQALRDRVERSHDEDVIEAVLTYDSSIGNSSSDAVAHSIVDQAARQVGVEPAAVRVLPQIGAMHITAQTALLCQLLADDRVSAGTIP